MIIALIPEFSWANSPNHKKYDVKLQIINDKNIKKEFWVKIAANEMDRKEGLMFVTNLPENNGMLFSFEEEQIVNMWMKNTKISLDMLFIDKNNQISFIKHNAKPESLDLISSGNKVTKVLEIGGGLAKKLGITKADKIKINYDN